MIFSDVSHLSYVGRCSFFPVVVSSGKYSKAPHICHKTVSNSQICQKSSVIRPRSHSRKPGDLKDRKLNGDGEATGVNHTLLVFFGIASGQSRLVQRPQNWLSMPKPVFHRLFTPILPKTRNIDDEREQCWIEEKLNRFPGGLSLV